MKSITRMLCLALLNVGAISSAFAAGYKMEFQSPSVLADGGDAAVVEDAGTNWYNSAGLVDLPQQLVGSVTDLYSRTKFTGSTTGSTNPLAGAPLMQGSVSSNQNIPLPALHYSLPFKDNRFAVGLSVVPAWGLAEDYGLNSLLRYDLTRIYSKSIDIAPSIAVKINKCWSLGAGPDFNYFSLINQSHSYTEALGTPGDSYSRVSADNWSRGWHAGVLLHLNEATRFGLNYRSQIVTNLKGYSSLSYPAGSTIAGPQETNAFSFHFVFPPTTSLSGYRDLSPCWAIMGTVTYDQWANLRDYNAQNYMSVTPGLAPPFPTTPIPVTLYGGYHNTFDWTVGTHYKLSEKWLLRGSLKYEPTPTGTQYRDVNFPDGDKLGIQIGGRYTFNKKIALDGIYGHVFTKTVPTRYTNPVTTANTNGHTSTAIDFIGAQFVWSI